MGFGKSVKRSKAGCSSLQGGKQQVAESPARGLIPDRLGSGGWGKRLRTAPAFSTTWKIINSEGKWLFSSKCTEDGEQCGLHQNVFRLRIKHHKLWHNYSITTKNLLVLRYPASASGSTVSSKSISSSEIMFLNLPHRPPIQDLESCMRFTYRFFFSFN